MDNLVSHFCNDYTIIFFIDVINSSIILRIFWTFVELVTFFLIFHILSSTSSVTYTPLSSLPFSTKDLITSLVLRWTKELKCHSKLRVTVIVTKDAFDGLKHQKSQVKLKSMAIKGTILSFKFNNCFSFKVCPFISDSKEVDNMQKRIIDSEVH